MKVADLKVIDVIQMPQFENNLYASVLDKTINISEYPSTLRTFIKGIGDEAFHRTMIKLKQAEEEQEGKQQIIGIKKDN